MSKRRLVSLMITFGAILLATQTFLAACRGQGQDIATPEKELAANSLRHTEIPSVATVTPSSTPTPLATATLIPTITPTATEIPAVRLAAPKYLEDHTLAAIQKLSLSNPSWRWQLVDQNGRADIRLELGDSGIPVGSRATALTVPFDADLLELTTSQAERMILERDNRVQSSDWAAMPPGHRALRVDGMLPDEQDYPIRENWSLVAADGFELAARALAEHLEQTIHKDPLIHLTAVGDLMLDRAIGRALENGDMSFPFGAVASALIGADLTVGNLESALGNTGQPENKSYTFQAPPEAADALALAGFDLLSMANNHALDYGPESLLQAIELLEQRGISAIGAGPDLPSAREPFIFEHDGLEAAFLSYVNVPVEVTGFDTRSWTATDQKPGLAWAEASQIREDVVRAADSADLVVVLLHSGYEYVQSPSPEQSVAAQAAIDAGADLVLGHHAHVLQGIQFGDRSAIVYGLGNFAFEIDGDPTTVILDVWLDSQGVRQIELTPAIIEAGGRPRIAAPWESPEIRQRVYHLSRMLIEMP